VTEHFAEYVQRLRRPGQYKPSTVQLAQVYALCIASAGQLQRLHNHEQVACLASTACTTASRSRGLVCTVRRHTAGFPTVSIINYFLDQEDRSISYRYRTHLVVVVVVIVIRLLVGATSSKNLTIRRFNFSNGIRMKFGMIVLQVNTHRLTESDFPFNVIISRRRP